MIKNVNISMLLGCYGLLLTDKQKIALDMYYNMDFSLSEIAENLGVSRQCARDFIKKGEANLLAFEEKTGLYKRTTIILNETEKIIMEIKDLHSKTKDELIKTEERVKNRLSVISDMETNYGIWKFKWKASSNI